jgi:hypothetical protein
MMAARGLVPVRGAEQLTLLANLAHDPDSGVAKSAIETLKALPSQVVEAGLALDLPEAVLHFAASLFKGSERILAVVVANRSTSNDTVKLVAKDCSEGISERIATNQQRMIAEPGIIEALYANAQTRMSTAERIVEFAGRQGLALDGIHTFAAHVEAAAPNPAEAPEQPDVSVAVDSELPPLAPLGSIGESFLDDSLEGTSGDEIFLNALGAISELDDDDASDDQVEKKRPIRHQIRDMSIGQKLRMTVLGNAVARAVLVRDPNKLVATATISSPRMTVEEVSKLAKSKEISEDVLNHISRRKDWLRNYDVKRSLVFNPKSAFPTAMSLMNHLRDADLRALASSRDVPPSLRNAAKQRLSKKKRKK